MQLTFPDRCNPYYEYESNHKRGRIWFLLAEKHRIVYKKSVAVTTNYSRSFSENTTTSSKYIYGNYHRLGLDGLKFDMDSSPSSSHACPPKRCFVRSIIWHLNAHTFLMTMVQVMLGLCRVMRSHRLFSRVAMHKSIPRRPFLVLVLNIVCKVLVNSFVCNDHASCWAFGYQLAQARRRGGMVVVKSIYLLKVDHLHVVGQCVRVGGLVFYFVGGRSE
jgi:hypothetical protein